MDKKSNILVISVLVAIIISGVLVYYRTMVTQNYIVIPDSSSTNAQ